MNSGNPTATPQKAPVVDAVDHMDAVDGKGRQYAMASLLIADAIAAHDFSLRERLVLDLVRKQSFGAGRLEAYIPALRFFALATRVSSGNVSVIISDLARKLVLEESPQHFYGFRLPVAGWKVPLRTEEIEVINQLALLDLPPHLGGALRSHFVEGIGADGSASLTGLNFTPIARIEGESSAVVESAGVPESGTPDGHQEGSRIGYASQVVTRARAGPVPESGTPHVTLQHCSIAQKECLKEQICNATTPEVVPESGTAPDQAAGNRRLNGEQQRLFDELRDVGAFGAHNESRGCWFGMVQKRADVVEWLLGELKYAKVSRAINNSGAWMMDRWIRAGRPNK